MRRRINSEKYFKQFCYTNLSRKLFIDRQMSDWQFVEAWQLRSRMSPILSDVVLFLGNFLPSILRDNLFFKKIGHSRRPFSLFFFSIQLTVNVQFNVCWWLDSNHGPLALEATALPTEPQPFWWVVCIF